MTAPRSRLQKQTLRNTKKKNTTSGSRKSSSLVGTIVPVPKKEAGTCRTELAESHVKIRIIGL